MTAALIGATGFVGSSLRSQAPFDELYDSKNIGSIRGRTFDLVVCAGARAEKWKANRDPDADRAGIERLIDPLREVRATRFVLVSTVDVYPLPVEVDESTPIDPAQASAYGRNRRLLEEFCALRFSAGIVRLPGLFGPGLKKNAIYDLLHDNQVDEIQPESVYQFYDIRLLWQDIERAARNGIGLLNVATEPVSMREIAERCFGRRLASSPKPAARYDMRSRHAPLWGGDHYLYGKERVLAALQVFVA
jgi:nucleoside-diphosphate-sugar epimerase